MPNESSTPVPVNYFLEPGFILVAIEPIVISTVLGSCVSVCLYDINRKMGGRSEERDPNSAGEENGRKNN